MTNNAETQGAVKGVIVPNNDDVPLVEWVKYSKKSQEQHMLLRYLNERRVAFFRHIVVLR